MPGSALLYGESLAGPGEARTLFNQLSSQLSGSPLRPQVALAAARTYEREQNWPAAVTNYESWLKDYPTNTLSPQVSYALAQANFQAGSETNAYEQFTNFIAQFPADTNATLAQWWVADHFFRAGDFVNAERNYKSVFEKWPASDLAYPAHMMAGRAAVARLDYTGAIRDYFTADIGELLIDEPAIYEQARQFMAHVMPGNVGKVKLYSDPVPLFSRFQIEHQIETAYSRAVPLPSGGSIVIDHTEALVAVDVNSAQATKGADIEQTAVNTNLEAADEVARQMRLRDLGGLIVIDFIDMENQKNQREVEDRLRDALHYDRARVQTGKISRFGLLEMSRQRLQPSLGETSYITCPRCSGTGHVRSTESFALHLLRMLQEESMKENTGAVHVQVPVDVATFLLNEKRHDILSIEARHRVEVVLIPNMHFETPRSYLPALGFGNCGFAYPAAMGAKVAAPDRPEYGWKANGVRAACLALAIVITGEPQ